MIYVRILLRDGVSLSLAAFVLVLSVVVAVFVGPIYALAHIAGPFAICTVGTILILRR